MTGTALLLALGVVLLFFCCAMRYLADALHGEPMLAEQVTLALCHLSDPDLRRFCEEALSSGVAEATDLVEVVLARRGLSGLTGGAGWPDRVAGLHG